MSSSPPRKRSSSSRGTPGRIRDPPSTSTPSRRSTRRSAGADNPPSSEGAGPAPSSDMSSPARRTARHTATRGSSSRDSAGKDAPPSSQKSDAAGANIPFGARSSSPARFNRPATEPPTATSRSGRSVAGGAPRTPGRRGGYRSELGEAGPRQQRSSRPTGAPGSGGSGGPGGDGGSDPPSGGDGNAPSTDNGIPGVSDMEQNLVWGTTINVPATMHAFREFFNNFEDPSNPGELLYPRMLLEIREDQSFNLNLDCRNLHSYDPVLYKHLISYPAEIIPIFDLVINEIFQSQYGEELQQRISVRTFNLVASKSMRDLNPVDIGQLVSVQGMITRVAPVTPSIRVAFFRCAVCRNTHEGDVERDQVVHPDTCIKCKSKQCMELIHNRSMFSDVQTVKLQETPEVIPQGETPQTVHVKAYDDLVDVAKPGDRVMITGIYRAQPQKVHPRLGAIKTVYRTFIDVIHFQKNSASRFGVEDHEAEQGDEEYTSFNEGSDMRAQRTEREQELIALGRSDDIYQKLTQSLAPSIWEMDDIKRGILCMLFGGTRKEIDAHGSVQKCRGEINVLLCGDPGTSKSQLLQFVHKIAPRGIYTSGRGSSAVGLTAYVTKDSETGDFILESGALVLSDRGVCCIDEFDKMSDQTRAILHEAMEQQTVSIAKAGIVASLNARTSVLASANPIESRYNPRMSVVDNIDLPPTLLSRFDIIYLVLDKANESSDRKLARHLVRLYYADPEIQNVEQMIDMKTLTEYISFARRKIHPVLSDEAVHDLIEAYVNMRTTGASGQTRGRKTISATPRQLESLIRLSESLARMRLSETVERHDVAEAVRLMVSALQAAATDPNTGLIDMDIIATGHSATQRARINDIKDALQYTLKSSTAASHKLSQLFTTLREEAPGLDIEEVREALYALRDEGEISLSAERRDPTVRVV